MWSVGCYRGKVKTVLSAKEHIRERVLEELECHLLPDLANVVWIFLQGCFKRPGFVELFDADMEKTPDGDYLLFSDDAATKLLADSHIGFTCMFADKRCPYGVERIQRNSSLCCVCNERAIFQIVRKQRVLPVCHLCWADKDAFLWLSEETHSIKRPRFQTGRVIGCHAGFNSWNNCKCRPFLDHFWKKQTGDQDRAMRMRMKKRKKS
jgi:hypothetical protein